MYFIRRSFFIPFLTVCTAMFLSGNFTTAWSADPPQQMDIKELENSDGIPGIQVNFFVKGKPDDVWKWIKDVKDIGKLFPAVKKIEKIKDIDDNTILWKYTLETALGTKVFNVKRTVDGKNYAINWKRTEGDMSYYGGSWKIKASEKFSGWVDCTYSNFVDAGWYIPYFKVKATSKENAESMVPSLRKLAAGK